MLSWFPSSGGGCDLTVGRDTGSLVISVLIGLAVLVPIARWQTQSSVLSVGRWAAFVAIGIHWMLTVRDAIRSALAARSGYGHPAEKNG
jgi:hypothetical protein